MRGMFSAKGLVLRAVECLMLLVIIGLVVCVGATACSAANASAPQPQRFSVVDHSDTVSVVVDAETSVEYLVVKNYTKGIAVTPIVDKNGDIYTP